jgi:hypothetical protein
MASRTLPPRVPLQRTDPQRIEATHLDPILTEPAVKPPRRLVGLAIFLVATIAYAIVGYRVTVDQHVVVFDALDRLTRAFQVWYDDPPKLAAIGFSFPPITTLVLLPFALIKPLATGLVALPLTTAVFGGLTVMLLDRTLARCEMPAFLRVPIVLGYAINPMTVFYAGNGMSEAVYLALLAVTLYAVVSWYETAQPRFLFVAGFGASVLLLTRYGFILWAAVLVLLIGGALLRREARRVEVEGSLVAFAAPALYAITLWVLFNTLIVGDPVGWLSAGSSQAVNTSGIASGGNLGFVHVLGRLVQVTVAVAPLAIAAVPAALLVFLGKRDAMGLWLASLVILGLAIMGVHAAIAHREGLLTLRDATPMALTAVVAAAWVYRNAGGLRLAVWGVTLVLLLVGLLTAYSAMKTYPFQSQEQAFIRAVRFGHDQEGTNSIGGFKVGIRSEAEVAAFINRTVRARHQILTDNADTFGVILLSGRPRLFFDRIIKGDGAWKAALSNPHGAVGYLLVDYTARGDLVAARYPGLAARQPAGFTVAFKNDRYLLLKVPARNPTSRTSRSATSTSSATSSATSGSGSGSGSGSARPPGVAPPVSGTSAPRISGQ